jgi:RNA polymerase sigma-70 factor (ECF subfamily)
MHLLDPESLPSHVDRLYRAAWALCGSREDAEDLVQETFARALARTRLVRGDSDLAYLLRCLRNTFFTTRRAAAARPSTVTPPDGFEPEDERSSLRPAEAAEVGELFELIAELPEQFRLAIVAVDVLGLSYAQAVHSLGVRESTIATRVYRARARVAERAAGTNDLQRESLVMRTNDG